MFVLDLVSIIKMQILYEVRWQTMSCRGSKEMVTAL